LSFALYRWKFAYFAAKLWAAEIFNENRCRATLRSCSSGCTLTVAARLVELFDLTV
jgi:hypothetical protein